ncbi:MAG: sodium:solute symporter [Acidobacteriota bacterium]|jgi:Na+/proline symporter|nr:sodium:solute symporter [Acidobacteriota bacterium]
MSWIDWLVMVGFSAFVVLYGVWKTRHAGSTERYLLAGRSTPWFAVMLSVMATQASAITFLSTPGQAYVDGMRFVQFYLGLPVAMIILCQTAVPLFHRLKVFTAYEFLEQRFDLKNRLLGAFLFLVQRGLAAGFTILAPALILTVLLGWELRLTVAVIGALVVLYTAVGGSEAVGKTHLLQMAIVALGMGLAFVLVLCALPEGVSGLDAVRVAGKLGKMNVLTFDFDWRDRYNFWSGLVGGTFLALSYFGTDQSQVSRYLAGRSVRESRIGLLANGIVKIPMQFAILLLGVLVFAYYQFALPPLNFNPGAEAAAHAGEDAGAYRRLEGDFARVHAEKQSVIRAALAAAGASGSVGRGFDDDAVASMRRLHREELRLRSEAKGLVRAAAPDAAADDTNYIFLNFAIHVLPTGLVGLVLAAILAASMSSTAAELNALASTTVIDIYKRLVRADRDDRHYLRVSRLATVFWGLFAIGFALFANRQGSLIEAVNILGSLFYGTILGLFLIAFFLKGVSGTPVFVAALAAEALVLGCFVFTEIPYLWYNVIGCAAMVLLACLLQKALPPRRRPPAA